MIAIGNGEPCPFCMMLPPNTEEPIFVMEEDENFLQHIINFHPDLMKKYLFGDDNVNM